MLKSVTLGYCSNMTDAKAQHSPIVQYYYDEQEIIRCRVLAHGDLDPIAEEILFGMLDGTFQVFTLEDIVDVFSSPHGSLQVISKEYS